MLEAARMQFVEAELAGVAERRVPQIVAQGDGLGQVLVEPQADRHGAGDLRHLEHMGEPGAVVVAGRGEEHLGLVLEPPEGLGMDDPVPVALEVGAQVALGFARGQPTPGPAAQAGVGGEVLSLPRLELFADGRCHGGQWRVASGCQRR